MRFSTAIRNAALDAMETAAGTAPTLEIRTGSRPANLTDAATGTVLATMTLPSDWMANAAAGAKGILGTWQDTAADAAGTAGWFVIRQGATQHFDGTVTITGGGGDLQLDNPVLAVGQQVTVTAFNLTAGAGS